MKWHWVMLLMGLGLYVLVLILRILPHAIDNVVAMLAGAVIATVAVFGFDTTHVNKRFATLMLVLSLLMLAIGIALARQGHPYVQLILSVPAA